MPTAAAGLSAQDAHGELTEQDRDIAALPGRADGVRQDWPLRQRHRPGAVLDGGDHHPAQAPRQLAQGLPRALVLELGARAGQAPAAADLAGARADDDRRARRAPGRAHVSAGLDERLDRAGARAHGHDVDGRAHARRGARRRGRSGAARRPRRRRRGRRAQAARHAQRRVRGARRRAPPGLRAGRAGAGALGRRSGARPRGRGLRRHGRRDRRDPGDRAEREAPAAGAPGARRALACTSRRRT